MMLPASNVKQAMAVGPDIWEVVSALRYTTGTDEQRVAALAEQFGLYARHIRTAIDFAAVHREGPPDTCTELASFSHDAVHVRDRGMLDVWATANADPYVGVHGRRKSGNRLERPSPNPHGTLRRSTNLVKPGAKATVRRARPTCDR
jgi:hypothetical protein